MKLNERIKLFRVSHKLQQKQLAVAIGIKQATVSHWESGRQEPNPEQRKKLCEVLGITEAELFGAPSTKNPLYVQKIPVISWIHANKFEEISPVNISDEYIYSDIKGEKIFALRVVNDCMAPEFNEGDIIIVNPELQADHDSFVVIADHEANTATFKQLKIYGSKKILHPLNLKYKDIELDSKKRYHIVGKVIAKETKYK